MGCIRRAHARRDSHRGEILGISAGLGATSTIRHQVHRPPRPDLVTPREGAPEPTYNADVYVFAVQTARTHESYDPLDIAQWEFYVLPRRVVEELNQQSVGLQTLQRLAVEAVAYQDLAQAIKTIAEGAARP